MFRFLPALIFLLIFLSPVFASTNLLLNPSFEEPLDKTWQPNFSTGIIEATSSAPKSGNYSLAVYKGKDKKTGENLKGYVYAYQDVGIESDKQYQLSGWIKLSDSKIKNAKLRLEWFDENDKRIRIKEDGFSDDYSDEFRFVKIQDTAPSGVKKARIECFTNIREAGYLQPALFDELNFNEVILPTNIFLSEFMPDPENGDEWVEIFNNNEFEVELEDWQIDDGEGGSSPQTFSAIISAKGFYNISLSSSKLNNDGDSVRLIKPDAKVIDQISYDYSHKGLAWAKDFQRNIWLETTTSTPGKANIITENVSHKGKISEIRKLEVGSKIEVDGFMLVEPNILGDDVIYIADESAGIKIKLNNSDYSYLQVGQKVKVSCTLEESHNEKYIKMEDQNTVLILDAASQSIEAFIITTQDVNEDNEGRLVKIKGIITEKESSTTFYVNDDFSQAKIYIKESTGIPKLDFSIGDNVEITGILSQYGFLKDGRPNYRVMPRYLSDINISSEYRVVGSEYEEEVESEVLGVATELPQTGRDEWQLLLAGFCLIAAGALLNSINKRVSNKLDENIQGFATIRRIRISNKNS